MLGTGFIGAGKQIRRRRESGQLITAVVVPASADLVVGQSLSDTPGWSEFIDPANYIPGGPGGTIDTVSVNFIGDTASADEVFLDGETNHFSITVTTTGPAPDRC